MKREEAEPEAPSPQPSPRVQGEGERRRWRRRFWTLATLLIVLGSGLIALHLALPRIVRGQIRDVLTKAGYPDAKFDIEIATAFGVRVANVSAGKHGELNIAAAKVDYSPLIAVFGRVDNVKIENANILIDLDALTPKSDESPTTQPSSGDAWSATNAAGLPVDRFDLRNCTVALLARSGNRLNVRLDGVLWRETWDGGDRARVSLQLRDDRALTTLDGSVDYQVHTIAASMTVNDAELSKLFPIVTDVDASGTVSSYVSEAQGVARMVLNLWLENGHAQTSGSLDVREGKLVGAGDFNAKIEGLFISVALESFVPPIAEPGQRIEVARVGFGDDRENDLSDVRIAFGAPAADQFALTRLSAEWAGGRVRATSPVKLSPGAKKASVTLSIDKIRLNPFLKLISGGRAGGEGTLSGELSVDVDWPHVQIGTGHIRSDGRGVLHFGNQVTDLAATVAKNDPRLRGQEQQLIDALTDFQFEQILFDFQRTSDGLKVVTRFSGRGLRGLKTPLDLTVNYTGLEEALNAYLGTELRVKNSGD